MTPGHVEPRATTGATAQPLAQALGRLRADLARHEPPAFADVWPAAAAPTAWPPPAPRPAPRSGFGWPARLLLFGAGAALLGTLVMVVRPGVPAPGPDVPQVVVRDGWELLPGGFVPVAGAERWVEPGRDVARGWLVRAELPAERLAGLGLPYDPGNAAARVPAELLLRANGELLAVRVLP